MGISDVVQTAETLLQNGSFSEAIPALKEVIRRIGNMADPATLATLQACRFQLARAYYKTGDPSGSTEMLIEYLKNEPRPQERLALRMLAQGYYDTQQWDKIIDVAGSLLKLPALSTEDVSTANLLLGQAYYRMEKWNEAVGPLTEAAKQVKDERSQRMLQIMLVRALVQAERFDEVFFWIPRLYRTDDKYDITLNLTLMKAGKARYEAEDYLNALLLYRMVLPREKMLDFQNGNVKALETELARLDKIGMKPGDKEARLSEIKNIKDAMEELRKLPPYEDEVDFRIGQIYFQVKRYWEGYVLLDELYQKDSKGDIGQAALLQSVLALYAVKDHARAEKRIIQYVEEHPNGQYVRILLATMERDLFKRKQFQRVVELRRYTDHLQPTNDQTDRLTEAEIHYMQAFAYLQLKEYAEANGQFGRIVEQYPNSPASPDALYYQGITYRMLGEYQKGLDCFKSYQARYSSGEQFAASVYREAICLFGLERVPEAEKRFKEFIGQYPDHELVSEAYSMCGDIEAAKDGRDNPATPEDEYDPHTLDRAIADYRKAIEVAATPAQGAYAAFQAAKVYKMEAKWSDIVDLMNLYLDRFGARADIAQAVYWIGQAQIQLQQVDQAVNAYIDAIKRFGNEVDQEGVDKIIKELVLIAKHDLTDDQSAMLATRVRFELSKIDASQTPLKIRLMVLGASLAGQSSFDSLGDELLKSIDDLRATSPLSLELLCRAAMRSGDFKQMDRIYNYFKTTYEDADGLWVAYQLRTHQQMAEKSYEEALATAMTALDAYGPDAFMAWAQLARADALYGLGRYDEAYDEYYKIMGVAAWRGPAFAQATIGMGKCAMAKKDYKKAHVFFQRAYLLYKAYDNGKWAADAYLLAAQCLLELGDEPQAASTLADMLGDPNMAALPQAEEARKLLNKHGGAR